MAGEGILFWFEAATGDQLAQNIIDHDANSFYRVEIEGRRLLKVGLNTAPKVSGRLISLGRDPAHNDLILPDQRFSKHHCHFYFNKSAALILRDTSSTKSTQIEVLELEDDRIYRLQGDPRQRVLLTKHQILMQIGPAQFRIIWHVLKEPSARQALEQAQTVFAQKQVAPEIDVTLLDLQSLPSTAYELRSQYTPSVASKYQKLPKIAHEKLNLLGTGTFGTVHTTVDLNTGNVWAVKTSNYHVNDLGYKMSLKLEVEILAELSHPNIVKFAHSQGWTFGSPVEIFMSLHEGSLMNLIPSHDCHSGIQQEPYFCALLVEQMLHAIAYLHKENIIHRDIKPENILYDHNGPDSSLVFYISDFGLSKKQILSTQSDLAGAPLYLAPEINQGRPYSIKVDIWSFAVTILQVLGYFCLREPDLAPEEWRKRMALLPGYHSDLNFEADQGPSISLSRWKYQLRWYGRLRSLVQHKMVPQLLITLLAEDVDTRPDAPQCLSLFFPERYKGQLATLPTGTTSYLKEQTPSVISRMQTSRQESSNLVRRRGTNRKTAIPTERAVMTALRPPRNLQGRKIPSLKTIEPPVEGFGR